MNGAALDYALVPMPGSGDAELTPSGLVARHHADHLASVRPASAPGGGVYGSSAYAPYGGLRAGVVLFASAAVSAAATYQLATKAVLPTFRNFGCEE